MYINIIIYYFIIMKAFGIKLCAMRTAMFLTALLLVEIDVDLGTGGW